ncbi:MAG TPA: xanthine dehydrogenase family protein molybdopterin-binding subunit [Acetobacteraceae bacterium]|nr:xanthine dehydrogenase family protein molybdopterin-binding subunit [Acetobacteraceae bacterium]
MSIIGQPLPRPEGPAKVTGRTRYTADQAHAGMLHAVLVGATIPAGRVVSIDVRPALRAAGVVRVLVAADLPAMGKAPVPPLAVSAMPMQGDEIRHEGQPIAIVLAETLEAAEHGAALVHAAYAPAAFLPVGTEAVPPDPARAMLFAEPELDKGDADAAIRTAPHRFEGEYTQPSRHHNAMEPYACLAAWDGDALSVHATVQHATSLQFVLAAVFGLPAESVRVICPHTGGGFGSKGYVWPYQILAAAAARVAGRAVKLVCRRSQMYDNVGYQPLIRQSVGIGTDAEGMLLGLRHEAANVTSITDDFVEFATAASRSFYATPNLKLRQRVIRAHVNQPTPMRAPVEGPGIWALESAMDELAHALRLDPLDLRLRNIAEADPVSGKPWSSCKLREAYEEGAALYGWRARSHGARDGHWRIGHGMASCSMGTFRFPAKARVRLLKDGSAVVETSTHDIGSGTFTIMPQIAADTLGLDPARVRLEAGDTRLPVAGPTYGSSSTMGTGSAVLAAALQVREKLARLTNLPPGAEAMAQAGLDEVVGDGSFDLPGGAQFEEGGAGTAYAIRTFGAVFVEVGVDLELGLLRLRRATGSYSVGRIINPRTARSQMTGGIIWGWGMAAMEASVHEPALGRWLSKNLSGVAIPVNADIPADIATHFVDEVDLHASPLGAKGIGEIGATGVAAAVANAVFDATGKRVRDLPILPEKLVDMA